MRRCGCRPEAPAPLRARAAPFAAVAGLLGLAGVLLALSGGPGARRVAGIGGPFALASSDGGVVTERSFAGRFRLVYFGYSACRDVCPVTLAEVGRAMDALGERAARVQPLFITVDPGHDTPEVLRAYLAGFTPRLVGLTGTSRQIRDVERAFRMGSTVHPDGARYAVEHDSVLYLLGPDGRYLAPIRADGTGAEIAAQIARHLS
ncbi:MAG: SCO family protein [Janthinobacterium lividum]